jgi:hypothetical protein
MICRGPVFFAAVIRLLAHLLPPSPATGLFFPVSPCVAAELTDGIWGEGGGRGAKSYDRDTAWPSINHSIYLCTPIASAKSNR